MRDRTSADESARRPTPKPWWREPWPWLLMLGPALAVVGCVITIVIAFQSYGDQAIEDGGTRQGLLVSRPAVVQAGQPDL